MIFTRESISEYWDEALPLVRAHDAELPMVNGHHMDPQRAQWERIEEINALVVFTARREQTHRLMGYQAFILYPNMIYPGVVWASQCAIYLDKEHRGRVGVEFMKYCDTRLTGMGVGIVVRQVTEFCDYSRTLKRLGYALFERGYMRDLSGRANA